MPQRPDNHDAEKLRSDANHILDLMRIENPSRPFFIEFSGTPKSGKSTCIDIVSHFFRRVGFKVLSPTEGASRRTPGFLKDDWFSFNSWSASYALTQVLEGMYSPEKYQIAILDRGLFDALAWFELLAQQSELRKEGVTPQDCEQVQKFLLIEKWRAVIDYVFLFRADPSTSLERETADKLVGDPGRAMNQDSLESLNKAYSDVHEKYAEQFQNFKVIDTSKSEDSTPKSTAFGVTRKILDLMSESS